MKGGRNPRLRGWGIEHLFWPSVQNRVEDANARKGGGGGENRPIPKGTWDARI